MKHLALILLLAGAALGQYEAPMDTTPITFGHEFGLYSAEFGGALGLSLCCGGGAALVASAPSILDVADHASGKYYEDDARVIAGSIISFGVWPAISAAGCYWVGTKREPGGNYLATLAGAMAGSAVGFGGWYAWQEMKGNRDGDLDWVTIPSVFLTSAVGAVYGYNMSIWMKTDQRYSAARILPPSATTVAERLDDGTIINSNRLTLVNMAF